MARRATAIMSERGGGAPLLVVSAGDFCGETGILERDRSRFLAGEMVKDGYGAVAVGERELNYGLRALRDMAAAGLPLICANLYEGGARVVPPSLVIRLGGTTVGVVALLGETPRETPGLELRDPAGEGRAAIAALRRRCDRVVLLAHMDRGKLQALLPSLEGVDLVIRGHLGEGEQAAPGAGCLDTLVSPRERGALPVFFAGDRGRNLGVVTFEGGAGGRVAIVSSRLVPLDSSVADDPEVANRVAAYLKEENVRQRALEISSAFARDEASGRLVEQYLGADVCARCHGVLMAGYLATAHVRALETLRGREQENDPSCLACHSTGYSRRTGYSPEAEKEGGPNLGGVQCEACHGPGTLHARDGSYVKSARASCRACHTSKWSPDFDFDAYWARVAHRPEGGNRR